MYTFDSNSTECIIIIYNLNLKKCFKATYYKNLKYDHSYKKLAILHEITLDSVVRYYTPACPTKTCPGRVRIRMSVGVLDEEKGNT